MSKCEYCGLEQNPPALHYHPNDCIVALKAELARATNEVGQLQALNDDVHEEKAILENLLRQKDADAKLGRAVRKWFSVKDWISLFRYGGDANGRPRFGLSLTGGVPMGIANSLDGLVEIIEANDYFPEDQADDQ